MQLEDEKRKNKELSVELKKKDDMINKILSSKNSNSDYSPQSCNTQDNSRRNLLYALKRIILLATKNRLTIIQLFNLIDKDKKGIFSFSDFKEWISH